MKMEYRRDGNQPLRKFSEKDEKRYQSERKDAKPEKSHKPQRGEKR